MNIIGWSIGFLAIIILTKPMGFIPAFIAGVLMAAAINTILLKLRLNNLSNQESGPTQSEREPDDIKKAIAETKKTKAFTGIRLTEKSILSTAAMLMTTAIFIHNPFSGYISSDEVKYGGEYQTDTIDPSECYNFAIIGATRSALSDHARESLSLILLERELTKSESEKLAFHRSEQDALGKKLKELEARQYIIESECRYVDKYTTVEREFLNWESRTPLVPKVKSIASLLYIIAFLSAISAILLVTFRRST